MKTHKIKLLEHFADAIMSGEKTFEIRKNDRGYQKGDYIQFIVVDGMGIEVCSVLNNKKYRITYVLNGWGIENGYVVFGIKEIVDGPFK